MQRLKVLGLAFMAVFMLGAVASAPAWAEKAELPKFGVETGGTGKFGKGKLNLTGSNITFEKGILSKFTTTAGTQGRLGTFDILDENAQMLGVPCLSLGDGLGLILLTGAWHTVHLPLTPSHVSILHLLNEVHVECPEIGLLILILANTSILLLITPVGKKTKTFTLLLNVKEGKQETNEWVDDEGKTHTTELLAGLNGGKDKAATEETEKSEELTTEKETIIEEK